MKPRLTDTVLAGLTRMCDDMKKTYDDYPESYDHFLPKYWYEINAAMKWLKETRAHRRAQKAVAER